MLQTSEGEVVSEDRGSESRTNGDEFGKPVPLWLDLLPTLLA